MPKRKEDQMGNKGHVMSFKITDDEKARLQKYAEAHNVSVSQVIRRAIRHFFVDIEMGNLKDE